MKYQTLLIFLFSVLLLAACGGQEAAEPAAEIIDPLEAATASPVIETAAPTPTETSELTVEAPSKTPTSVPVEDETKEVPPTEPAIDPNPITTFEPTIEVEESAVVQVVSGQTAEGAFFYGNPDAPVTLFDYSDFL